MNRYFKKNKKVIKAYFKNQFSMHIINPLASPSVGTPALKYGDVNKVTPSPGEVKGLIIDFS